MEKIKKQRVVDDKISLFGILSATKAITNPVNKMQEVQEQQLKLSQENLQVSREIAKSEAVIADTQKALIKELMRVATALERMSA